MAKRSLRALAESLADVGDAKGCFVWGDNAIVNDRGEVEGDIVFSHADLLGNLCNGVSNEMGQPLLRKKRTDNLNLDVDVEDSLGERIDLDQAWIDGPREATELGDETDFSLVYRLKDAGADDAARNGAQVSDDGAEGVLHVAVPCMSVTLLIVGLDGTRVRRLKVLSLRRLDLDEWLIRVPVAGSVDGSFAILDAVCVHGCYFLSWSWIKWRVGCCSMRGVTTWVYGARRS